MQTLTPEFRRLGRSGIRAGMRGRLLISLSAGMLCLLALVFLVVFRGEPRTVEPVAVTVLPQPMDLVDFQLLQGNGEPFTRASLAGRHQLVFFGFTNCPDVCPITLQQLAAARRRLADLGVEPLPDIVFVSVDPERDSLADVRDYSAAFGDGVTGVRGDLAEIDRLASALGVFHARSVTATGYEVEHSGAVLVIDDEARFSAVFSAPHEVEDFVHDWPLLVGED